jgi:hypothetical protein
VGHPDVSSNAIGLAMLAFKRVLRVWNCGTPVRWGMRLTISASEVWVDWPGERSGVHRSERPATGSYALVPVDIKQKDMGTWVKSQFPVTAFTRN